MFSLKVYRDLCRFKVLFNVKSSLLRNKFIFKPVGMCYSQLSEGLKDSTHVTDHRSKWNELSHTEAGIANTFISFKYMRLIKAAVREFGPIIEENPKLASLIESAHKHSLPQDFIDFALRISVDVRAKLGLFELQLPSSCHFIIQYEDIDASTTKHHLIELCRKYDVTLVKGEVKWPHYFEQKGILVVKCDISPFVEEAEAEKCSSRVGAENVIREIDAEGIAYWKFHCDPCVLHDVKRHLNEENVCVEESFVGYIGKTKIIPSDYLKKAVCNVLLDACKIPTVDNIYENIE